MEVPSAAAGWVPARWARRSGAMPPPGCMSPTSVRTGTRPGPRSPRMRQIPETWDCPRCGLPSNLDSTNPPPPPKIEPYKTHLAYVKERRSDAEAADILAEALQVAARSPGGRRSHLLRTAVGPLRVNWASSSPTSVTKTHPQAEADAERRPQICLRTPVDRTPRPQIGVVHRRIDPSDQLLAVAAAQSGVISGAQADVSGLPLPVHRPPGRSAPLASSDSRRLLRRPG